MYITCPYRYVVYIYITCPYRYVVYMYIINWWRGKLGVVVSPDSSDLPRSLMRTPGLVP